MSDSQTQARVEARADTQSQVDSLMLRVIGRNVRRARVAAGVTQECLAEIIGVHWQTVSYLENGRFPFAVTHLVRIGQALEVSVDGLLTGVPPLEPKRVARIKKALARKRRPSTEKG